MTDQSESSYLLGLYEAALQNYEKQTGMALDKHPLAERLQDCDSVDSFTSVLREQTQAFSEFWGKDKIMKLFKNVVTTLYKLSAVANFGQAIGLVRP